MNSTALEVSKSNLEAILSDSLLRSFGYVPQKGYSIEVDLTVPDIVPIKINYIKEVTH